MKDVSQFKSKFNGIEKHLIADIIEGLLDRRTSEWRRDKNHSSLELAKIKNNSFKNRISRHSKT